MPWVGRRRRLVVLSALGFGALVLLGPWALLQVTTSGERYDIDADGGSAVPTMPVAIVLGAGLAPDGSPSPFLRERVTVGAGLYLRGTVRALLMSGDNSSISHDEVTAMALLARRLGVPARAIVLDYAGFDTYSSCYRARRVFGVRQAVVVTQPFHLPRAVWLCRSLGVDAVGVATGQGDRSATAFGWAREVPAAAKAVWDVVTGRLPIFIGPPEHELDDVTGGGSGETSV